MPAPFAARQSRVSGAIDKAFGEALSLAGRKAPVDDVNLPSVADATRPQFDFVGTFNEPGTTLHPDARGSASDHAQQRSVTQPVATIDDALLQWPVREKDVLTRDHDGAVYEVARALPNGFGRTVLYLTAKK